MTPDQPGVGARLRAARKARGLVVADLAARFREVAPPPVAAQLPTLKNIERTIRHHEAGTHTVGPRYRLLYTAALEASEDELFGVDEPEDALTPRLVTTVELARRLRLSDVDQATLDSLAAITESLCTQYAHRPPPELRAEAQHWFVYVGQLLGRRVGLAEHRELLVTAAWLALLIGCLEYDSGFTATAEGTRRSAMRLGHEAGHSEITAWGLEMASWFAHTRQDPERTVAFARAGQAAAGSTGVTVQLVAHEARALARMNDVHGVHEALDRGHALLSRMPRPSNPRNHFVVDPDKFDFYAMDAYRVVGANDRAAAHAAEVLRSGRGPSGEDLAPMRMAEARLTLAAVAARAGDLEEAVQRGQDALNVERKCVPSLLLVASELHEEIGERYPADQAVREFSERLRELRRPQAGGRPS